MKREDLKRAIELNKEIEELERNRNFLEANTKNCSYDIGFNGERYNAVICVSELSQIEALEDVEKFKNIILEKFNNKIEELTKEFESL